MDLGRIVRAGAWSIVGVVGFALAAYLAFVAINWNDEPPSADAARMAASVRDRPAVEDDSNAFVHLLGLAAPPDADPLALGRERKAWMEAFDPEAGTRARSGYPGEDADYRAARPGEVADLASACPGPECAEAVRAKPEALDRWIESERWLLARYRRMLDTPAWREVVPRDPRAPLVPFLPAFDMQAVHLLAARQHAAGGNAAEVRELLERDLAFWRRILAASDLMISKMIAVAAIERHFESGNLVLRTLPAGSVTQAIPSSWRRPLSPSERSLSRVLAGDFLYAGGILDVMFPQEAGGERLSSRLFRPGYQRQATRNLDAARKSRWAEVSEQPYAKLGTALLEARRVEKPSVRLYNPSGALLDSIASGTGYADYVARAADVEGMRRAALLAVTLRADGIEPSGAEGALRDAELRNPYTGAPFAWDAASGSIVFQGLEQGERGRFAAPL